MSKSSDHLEAVLHDLVQMAAVTATIAETNIEFTSKDSGDVPAFLRDHAIIGRESSEEIMFCIYEVLKLARRAREAFEAAL